MVRPFSLMVEPSPFLVLLPFALQRSALHMLVTEHFLRFWPATKSNRVLTVREEMLLSRLRLA